MYMRSFSFFRFSDRQFIPYKDFINGKQTATLSLLILQPLLNHLPVYLHLQTVLWTFSVTILYCGSNIHVISHLISFSRITDYYFLN